jgi:hypothetical protein
MVRSIQYETRFVSDPTPLLRVPASSSASASLLHLLCPLTILAELCLLPLPTLLLYYEEISTMGKGGDAAAKSKGMQLADKVQKYTWAEVKKHVS